MMLTGPQYDLIPLPQRAHSLRHLQNRYRTYSRCLEAIRCADVIGYIPEEHRTVELLMIAIKMWGCREVPIRVQKMVHDELSGMTVREQLDAYPRLLELRWWPHVTEELCLEAVRRNWRHLRNVPEEFLTAEVCIAALGEVSAGYILQYVPDKIKPLLLQTKRRRLATARRRGVSK